MRRLINANIHLKDIFQRGVPALFFKLFGVLVGYVFLFFVAKYLGAAGVGAFTLAFTMLMIMSVLGRFGLDIYLLRVMADKSGKGEWDSVRDAYNKALSIALLLGLILSMCGYVFSPYIAKYILGKNYFAEYLQIIVFAIIPVVIFYINSECIRAIGQPERYSFLQNVSLLLFATVLFVTVPEFNRSISGMLWSVVVAAFITFVLSQILWWRSTRKYLKNHEKHIQLANLEQYSFRRVAGESFPLMFVASLTFVMTWTDVLMIGYFLSEDEVGKYSVALRISYLISFVLYAVNSVVSPRLAAAYGRGDLKVFRYLSKLTSRLGMILGLMVFVLILLLGKWILSSFGYEFMNAWNALVVLSVGQIINSSCGSVGYILSMTGRQRALSYIIACSAAVNVALNAFLIPRYGIDGASVATMVSTVVWNIVALIYINRTYHFWMIGLARY